MLLLGGREGREMVGELSMVVLVLLMASDWMGCVSITTTTIGWPGVLPEGGAGREEVV